jgi:hypothetical protein
MLKKEQLSSVVDIKKSGGTLVVSKSKVTDESGVAVIAEMLATMIVSHVKRED